MTTQNKWFAMSRKTDAQGKESSGAEISINDNIGGWGITANDFIAELKDLGDVDTINVRISSGGGSIVEGNAIFNALKRHPAKVVTHIDSLAASMASVIAMAGDEVRMAANGLFMIHNPWTASIGGAEKLRKDADLLDKMGNNIRNSYDRSNLSVDELSAAMDKETFYTADEALEAGFIDSISDANFAAASIGDFETAKDFKIPQAKIDGIMIKMQAKQLEVANAQLADISKMLAGDTLGNFISGQVDDMVTDDKTRGDVINDLASAASISTGTVNSIISGDINCPPADRLRGFATVIDATFATLVSRAEDDGCNYERDEEGSITGVSQCKIDTSIKSKIEALDARATELAGDLDTTREDLTIQTRETADAKAEVTTLKEDATKATEAHVEALATATEQTQKAISAKAAEMLAESGHPPIEGTPEGSHVEPSASKMSEADFWDKYNSLPVNEQNAFYAENIHLTK